MKTIQIVKFVFLYLSGEGQLINTFILIDLSLSAYVWLGVSQRWVKSTKRIWGYHSSGFFFFFFSLSNPSHSVWAIEFPKFAPTLFRPLAIMCHIWRTSSNISSPHINPFPPKFSCLPKHVYFALFSTSLL